MWVCRVPWPRKGVCMHHGHNGQELNYRNVAEQKEKGGVQM